MNKAVTITDFNTQLLDTRHNLKSYAIKLTKNTDDANDLIQDTLTRALINKNQYRSGTNLRAWLYAIMRNTFINNYRKSRHSDNFNNTMKYGLFVNSPGSLSSDHGYSRVMLKALYAEVERLPWVYRIPFELHTKGYKYKEIADMLRIPIDEVKSNIYLARKKLKKRWGR